jgi:transmembrane sensor
MPVPHRPPTRYQLLARKWLNGTINATEKQAFADWYNQDQDKPLEVPEQKATSEAAYEEKLLADLRQRITPKSTSRSLVRNYIAAAILLAVFGLGAYVMIRQHFAQSVDESRVSSSLRILPGGDKAYLTLGSGEIIHLDDTEDGPVNNLQAVKILKSGGTLIYGSQQGVVNEVSYHTVHTPKGGQFKIVLPDGTRVWLNSASTLQFPTRFDSGARKVKLTGEGYFEVEKWQGGATQSQSRFIIDVGGRETVEVLGTHLNIKAYEEESVIQTTLLEGSVKLSKTGTHHTQLLKPGQQSVYNSDTGYLVDSDIDVEKSVSWKNGVFSFERADIKSIMRQIERWYDVTVVYEGDIPTRLFNGGISKYSDLEDLLVILEANDIHFDVKGRTITVKR